MRLLGIVEQFPFAVEKRPRIRQWSFTVVDNILIGIQYLFFQKPSWRYSGIRSHPSGKWIRSLKYGLPLLQPRPVAAKAP